MRRMDSTTTGFIVETLTRSIVEHRLQPGAKLVEQTLADQFGVSRTLIRQALFKLSQNRLIRKEPARGAFVAAPSMAEAKQVFDVRRMLEAGMTQAFIRQATPQQINALKDHIAEESAAVMRGDIPGRTVLLGDTANGPTASKYRGYVFDPMNGKVNASDVRLSTPLVSDTDLVAGSPLAPAQLKPLYCRHFRDGQNHGAASLIFADGHAKSYTAAAILAQDGGANLIWRFR